MLLFGFLNSDSLLSSRAGHLFSAMRKEILTKDDARSHGQGSYPLSMACSAAIGSSFLAARTLILFKHEAAVHTGTVDPSPSPGRWNRVSRSLSQQAYPSFPPAV